MAGASDSSKRNLNGSRSEGECGVHHPSLFSGSISSCVSNSSRLLRWISQGEAWKAKSTNSPPGLSRSRARRSVRDHRSAAQIASHLPQLECRQTMRSIGRSPTERRQRGSQHRSTRVMACIKPWPCIGSSATIVCRQGASKPVTTLARAAPSCSQRLARKRRSPNRRLPPCCILRRMGFSWPWSGR